MPEQTSNDLGNVNDVVTLRLGGRELLISESYDVRMSFFRQPSVFALRTGWGGTTLELLDKYPPNTPFSLEIGGRLQFTGRLDAVNAEQSSGATEITFHGRDDLAPLHDSMANAERSFDKATYVEMVDQLLTDAGIGDYTLFFSDEANIARKTGVSSVSGSKVFGRSTTAANSAKKKGGQLKVGERRYEFLKKELDRGGLFLMAGADFGDGPTFILTQPNTDDPPRYRILRERGLLRDKVNVTSASFKNDVAKRFAAYTIFGRSADKNNKTPVSATILDEEMIGYGFTAAARTYTARVDTCTSIDEAQKLAWRERAENRREGYVVNYTVAGHSIPALNGRTRNDRAVWAVNTVVDVFDREYGIYENMWITDVQFQRDGSGTRTGLTLVSASDWVPP
jgi:prophage tail gpP-like protein